MIKSWLRCASQGLQTTRSTTCTVCGFQKARAMCRKGRKTRALATVDNGRKGRRARGRPWGAHFSCFQLLFLLVCFLFLLRRRHLWVAQPLKRRLGPVGDPSTQASALEREMRLTRQRTLDGRLVAHHSVHELVALEVADEWLRLRVHPQREEARVTRMPRLRLQTHGRPDVQHVTIRSEVSERSAARRNERHVQTVEGLEGEQKREEETNKKKNRHSQTRMRMNWSDEKLHSAPLSTTLRRKQKRERGKMKGQATKETRCL